MRVATTLSRLILLPPLALTLLLADPARAQRLADDPATPDPFGRPAAPVVPGGRYRSHTYQRGILTVYATDGSARQVQPWAEGVVKISYFAPGRRPVPDSSVSVVQAPVVEETEELIVDGINVSRGRPVRQMPIEMTTTKLLFAVPGILYDAEIDKATLRIRLIQNAEALVAETGAPFRRRAARGYAATDENTPPGRADERAGVGLRLRLAPGERLYGTGARALPLDRRGYRLELYNQAHYGYGQGEENLNVTLPVVLSSRGYLLLFDTPAAGYLDLGKQDPTVLEYGAQDLTSLSYFVVTGRSQGEILERYTALTGRQPLPPRWALGLIQSRFGYRSQAEMLDVARRMRAADFPLDALVLDLYWFGGTTRQGDFRWDAKNFPDPAGMMRDLKSLGVQTILISEPYVMRTSLNDSLVRTQGLVGTTAAGRPFTVGSFWAGPASILDVFKPATRSWLWAQYQRLHEQGAAGWWSDLGEPENHPVAMRHAAGSTRAVHNAYGLRWAQLFADEYAKNYPNERLFNLARSGWAGMQRNSVFPWSGDVSRTWSGLRAQVPIMLGMGQAGVGYMHSDAGGFGANADRDPELYTRWLQMAALGPILRPHSDQVVPPEPYTYPEPYQGSVRHYAHLRMELLPYLYTLAAQNSLTGAPLVRALDYDSDEFFGIERVIKSDTVSGLDEVERLYLTVEPTNLMRFAPQRPGPPPADDQFLLGPSLLVAPVSEPGQRRRNVVLPATPGGWIDWETGQTLPGGQTVSRPAPLTRLPLLVRAGAVVPLTAYRPSTARYRTDTLVVRYFPDPAVASGAFRVYEDDGRSAQAVAKERFGTVLLLGTTDATQTTFNVRIRGNYPNPPSTRRVQLYVARVAAAPARLLLNGEVLPPAAWRYNATRQELVAEFPVEERTTLQLPGLQILTTPAAQTDPDHLLLRRPDSRTFSDNIRLPYHRYLPGPATLVIRDAAGRRLRALPAAAGLGEQAAEWDGRDDQGRPVPPGVYDVELDGQHQRVAWL